MLDGTNQGLLLLPLLRKSVNDLDDGRISCSGALSQPEGNIHESSRRSHVTRGIVANILAISIHRHDA